MSALIEAQNEPLKGDDPTEHLPVMRHHLHEALMAVDNAYMKSSAEDIVDAYRNGAPVSRSSKLTEQLMRTSTLLAGYLGLLDDPEENDEETQRVSQTEDE